MIPLAQLPTAPFPQASVAAPNPQYPDEMAQREIVNAINTDFERRRKERQPWDLQWKLNLEFLLGNQYVYANAVEGKLKPHRRLYWYQEQQVFNQIRPIYLTRTARLTNMKPMVRVRPGSSEQDDIYATHVSTAVLKQNWFDDECPKKLAELVHWLEIQGTAFKMLRWDPQAGRFLGLLEQPTEEDIPPTIGAVPGSASEKTRVVRVHEGDLTTDIVPAEFVYPDTIWRNDVSDCESIIIARVRSVKSIRDQYGVNVKAETVETTQLQPLMSTGSMFEREPCYVGVSVPLKDHVVEKHHMEKPSGQYPFGRYIIVAGDKVLYYKEELPYKVGKDDTHAIPLVRAVCEPRPGCFFGIAVIERLIPIQRRYNRVRNLISEHLKRVGIGQWTKPNNACPDSALWQGPGAVINFNPIAGMKPEPVHWDSLPVEFKQEIEWCLQEFTTISGVSELSRFSEAPPGVKAGVALSIAQEQDETRLTITASSIERAIVEWSKMRLRMYRQFVLPDRKRVVRDVGSNDIAEIVAWSSSDIRSDDVVLEAGPGLSDTPAQQQQKIYDMLESPAQLFRDANGQITTETKKNIFEGLRLAMPEIAEPDEDSRDRKRIARENMLLKQGIMPPVFTFDNHPMHIQRHNWERKTAWYEAIIKRPEGAMIVKAFDDHNAIHASLLQRAMMQANMFNPQQAQLMMPQRPAKPVVGPFPEKEPITTPPTRRRG
ncbi:MAG: hypothetical protein C4521_10895 [Actinobacteria bacterium]|nr:MAG: hypothetical protein C4521_10895 [Actinomycetota bacterium]